MSFKPWPCDHIGWDIAVHHQIERHKDGGDGEHDPHHLGIVSRLHRAHEKARKPRPVVDELDEHGAAEAPAAHPLDFDPATTFGDGDFGGADDEADWGRFFAGYRDFIVHYARLAEAG